MKVKIGDKIYDSKDEPILVVFKDGEIESLGNIFGMRYPRRFYKPSTFHGSVREGVFEYTGKFCAHPEGYDPDEIDKFMRMGDDDE